MNSRNTQSGQRRAGYFGTTMDTQQTIPPLGQSGLSGFNGVVFESGGGTPGPGDLIHESPSLQRPYAYQHTDQSALQREVLQLRRANQALVAAHDARYHAAVKLLGDITVSDNSASDDKRRQLTRLLLTLLDPAAIDEQNDLDTTDSQHNSAAVPPSIKPTSTFHSSDRARNLGIDNLPSRPQSRDITNAKPAVVDWDASALCEVANQGHVARNESSGDRYAAESRKAIGSHSFQSFGRQQSISRPQRWQSAEQRSSISSSSSSKVEHFHVSPTKPQQEQPRPMDNEKLGPLAISLMDARNSQFEQDPNSRFVLYSPSAGIFQAPTLDALRSGNMTLADIVEASVKLVSLDRLQHDRIAEQEAANSRHQSADAASIFSDSEGDNALHIATTYPRSSKPKNTPAASYSSNGGCFWLDITNPTPDEIASLARVFNIHPLTVEDIMTEDEGRDKFETFSGYNFIVYRTIDYGEDAQSNYEFNRGTEGIATANFAIVLKQSCILTFHRTQELNHVPSVISRLLDLVPSESTQPIVTPAYIAYALVDDITDTLAPEMRSIELEVDAADELVLILSTNEQSDMLKRIGSARRKILTLWRLLQGKPDVIRAFSRLMDRQAALDEMTRVEDDVFEYPQAVDMPLRQSPSSSVLGPSGSLRRTGGSSAAVSQLGTVSNARRRETPLWPAHFGGHLKDRQLTSARTSSADLAAAPVRSDIEGGVVTADEIAHYLSDVYDHLVSLVGSSSHCDMVLSRAHSNYLARLSLGLGESTVETNLFASRWTVIGAILVPLNVVTGLWGMNVKVPGQDREDLRDFFLILAGCMAFVLVVIVWARYKKIF
ncbi:CorA metal ion transporter [Coemansia sp. RSA 989]|nr:CorA metal ion transporter [Coemansia sp. RSA 1821]KAJ1867980.1 CorA metal ion transporter [Coemansia sp. RSA 989]KAJ1875332.1 CorA metal ion transporter [Coemansia sp. RSA 990]KAJ2674308.1 CorA metal ion transporter [Coemansia sp. RSA 1085]